MKSRELVVYLSVPLSGLSFKEADERIQNWLIPLPQMGFNVLDPLAGKSYLGQEKELKKTGYQQPPSTDHAIFNKDQWAVKKSDIVIVDLRKTSHIHIGCIFEIAWAQMFGKLVIVLMEKDNIHSHAFVKQAATMIFSNPKDVFNYLKDLNSRFLSK